MAPSSGRFLDTLIPESPFGQGQLHGEGEAGGSSFPSLTVATPLAYSVRAMTRVLKSLCSRPGCNQIAIEGAYHCPNCGAEEAKANDQRRGSASSRGYGSRWRRLRLMVLNRDRWTCKACGYPGHHADHITPKGEGGDDSMSNLQTLCKPCHDEKSSQERRRSMVGGMILE